MLAEKRGQKVGNENADQITMKSGTETLETGYKGGIRISNVQGIGCERPSRYRPIPLGGHRGRSPLLLDVVRLRSMPGKPLLPG